MACMSFDYCHGVGATPPSRGNRFSASITPPAPPRRSTGPASLQQTPAAAHLSRQLRASMTKANEQASSRATFGVTRGASPPAQLSPLTGAVEVIPGRLYWNEAETVPAQTGNLHAFSIDQELVYEPICMDFGPMSLAMVWKYCRLLEDKLSDPAMKHHRILHVCSSDAVKRTNAAFLICAHQVVVKGVTAEAAYAPFRKTSKTFVSFRDASSGPCNFQLTIEDCLKGLEFSIRQRLFAWDYFDADSYEYFAKVEHGDMNWVIPGKFLAFAGPMAAPIDAMGYPAFTPEDYAPLFEDAGIGLVVRLNKPQYDKVRFENCGIKHADLYFPDGSCPPKDIIEKFLQLTESHVGAIGVHCKAGLGRTGTLIGLYAMKHFQFPARAFIGWSRICRPGSILGAQQQFLLRMESDMFQLAAMSRRPLSVSGATTEVERALSERARALSLHDSTDEEQQEDVGQGERLCNAKRGSKPGCERLKCLDALRTALSGQTPDAGASARNGPLKANVKTSCGSASPRTQEATTQIWSRETSADSLSSKVSKE